MPFRAAIASSIPSLRHIHISIPESATTLTWTPPLPAVEACAKALKSEHGFERLGAIGFCYGGWGVCHLASKARGEKLVDVISMGHPSWLVKDDIANLTVPVQFLAPEIDPAFPAELKTYTFETLLKLNLPFDYVHYPGIVHGGLVRGKETVAREREAMAAAKNSAVAWFKQHLHPAN